MATKLFIIVTPSSVYATYHKTICYKAEYHDEDSKWSAIKEAKATAFGYGLSFGDVSLGMRETHKYWNDQEVFDLLEKEHQR
jgi:predicted amidohydrolase